MAKKKFYVVISGRQPGLFYTWDEAKAQVDGFSGSMFKSFSKIEDAKKYADAHFLSLKVPNAISNKTPRETNTMRNPEKMLKKISDDSDHLNLSKRAQADVNLFNQHMRDIAREGSENKTSRETNTVRNPEKILKKRSDDSDHLNLSKRAQVDVDLFKKQIHEIARNIADERNRK